MRTNTIGTRCLPRCSRSSGRKTAASCCRVLPLSRCRVRPRLRVYAGLFHRFGRGQAQSETLFRLDEAAVSSRSRKVFQFPGGVCITTDGDGVLMKTGEGGRTPSEERSLLPSPLQYIYFSSINAFNVK